MEGDWRGWCTLNRGRPIKNREHNENLEQFTLPFYLCGDRVITGVTLWTVEYCLMNGQGTLNTSQI